MSACIEWTGRRDKDGYGIDGRRSQLRQWGTPRAHRIAWMKANGPIPDGLCVCHHCDNPACINVEHLWLGTTDENNKDKAAKGRSWRLGRRDLAARTHCLNGHEFTPENTYVYRNVDGWHRSCRACQQVRGLAFYHANKDKGHAMNRSLTALALTGALAAGLAATNQAHAQPVKNCGGQQAAPQPVPYTCVLPPKVIDGTAFSAVVHADGKRVVVTITLAQPRTVDTPARIVHHVGISGAGLNSDEAQKVIPAGQTSVTLRDSAPCTDGQLDVKAVFTGNGDAHGRIGGPWIQNGIDCLGGQPIVPPPPASSTPVPPTAPPATTPGAPSPGPGASTPTLPATGASHSVNFWLALVGSLIIGGSALVKAGVRRP